MSKGEYLAILVALAVHYCHVITSLSPMECSLNVFSLLQNMSAHPDPSSPLPLTLLAFTGLRLAARRKVFDDFWRSGRSLLLSYN